MDKQISILALGLDKNHFQEKFEYFYKEYKYLKFLLSYNPIPDNFKISKLDRIDASKLYDRDRIFEAFGLNKKAILDSKFLSQMYECESLFFSTLDRCSTEKRSITEDKSYFEDLLLFFKSFFESKQDITHIFFPSTPHFPLEIVLFYVSKYFSIKSIILNRTDFNNKFFFREDWRHIHHFNKNIKYNSVIPFDFTKGKQESGFVKYSNKLNESSKDNFKVESNPFKLLLSYYKLFKISINYFKGRKDSSIYYLNKRTTWLDIFISIIKRFKKDRSLKVLYGKLIKEPDLTNEYIYFPLHFQPERSTDPEGLHFSNQLTTIHFLRDTIPSNIFLYIKEHPRQFDNINFPDLRKNLYRNENFYKKISSLENTELISINKHSDIMIEKSIAVVTLTGSSGWQAIKKLKPTLIFGYPWYANFKGCFHIKTKSDIKMAFSKINESKSLFTGDDVTNYIKLIKDKLFDAYIGSFFFTGDEQDYNKIVQMFSNNLNEFIKIDIK